jgi:zinc/manganese transport system ATP-binding protein
VVRNKHPLAGSETSFAAGASSGRATPTVVFEDVAVRLGGRLIWSSASFQIEPGECVALLGPNGSGKTTLLRVILGQISPSAGRVTVLGGPPRRGNRAISLVPQRRELTSDLSIRSRDLVLLGINGHRWGVGHASLAEQCQANQALQAVDALAYADQPVGTLSGGEQQRVFIAQALLDDLQLLLLDEPLASLDLKSQREIVSLIGEINRGHGVTTIIVTHDLNPLFPVIDHVLCILDGHPSCGPVAEMIDPERLSRLYGTPVLVLRTGDGDLFVRGA